LVAASQATVADRAGPDTRAQNPLPAHPSGLGSDCEICFVVSMTGSGMVPTPPQLFVPGMATRMYFRPGVDNLKLVARHSAFQARGPPRA
jgi:hypothetical protein